MLGKIFRKDSSSAQVAPLIEIDDAAQAAAMEAAHLSAKHEWEAKLQAALDDDAMLLALAGEAPLLDIKQAAILALKSEAALKSAEREFRTHDRRVHRLAKQRYEALLAQREMRERAERLIEAADILASEPIIPANRLVELDQGWRALDAALLEEAQYARFAELQAKLTGQLRERGDRQRAIQRWASQANETLTHLNAACSEAAAGSKAWAELAEALAAASDSARSALSAIPAAASPAQAKADITASLAEGLHAALQKAEQIGGRLKILSELHQGNQAQDTQSGDATMAATETLGQRWQALPVIADTHINDALNARFEEEQRIKSDVRKARHAEKKQRAREKNMAARQAQIASVEALLGKAEASLAAGHLAETGQHLTGIQDALKGGEGALSTRIHALQAEYARLRGWQHWGGGRVRDDLVQEAEALARNAAGEGGTYTGKATIKQHAGTIEKLRVRWKELDRLGGATSRELWKRFDDALKAAYLPVAAHWAKLNTVRQNNLAARKALVAALETVKLPDAGRNESPDWRTIARALDHFQIEWRKLGPVEHTVPNKDRDELIVQMTASVARLDNPLQKMRQNEESARKELIARAQALSTEVQSRDLVAKVRALQAEWQQHAKAQPLARRAENALWADFKAAIDAVFSRRQAVYSARDAELKANQAAREALIAHLRELHQDTPPADIKRILAEVETEWRKAGEPPRSETVRLNEEFHGARNEALRHVAGSGQRVWHNICDTLAAKLTLCEEAEAGAQPAASAAEAGTRWSALPALPSAWEQALGARFRSVLENVPPIAGVISSADELNTVLLQLESALDMASPAAFQDARRALSLRLMKSAMEGRQPANATTDLEKLTAAAFGYARPDATQQQRLAAIIAALRSGKFGVKGDKITRLPSH